MKGDIERVCHDGANLEQGHIVHLCRLSKKLSGRDWPTNSKQILSKEDVAKMTMQKSVEIFYGMHNDTDKSKNGVWLIRNGTIKKVTDNRA